MKKKNNDFNYEYNIDSLSAKDIIDKWNGKETLKNGAEIIANRIHTFEKSQQPNTQELKDIINQIVLWKVNRQVFFDDEGKRFLRLINKFGQIKGSDYSTILKENEEEIKELLIQMISCKGIQLPMASTILHFFCPEVFLIIDQRAFRVVTEGCKHRELKAAIKDKKTERKCSKEEACAEVYLDYLKACKAFFIKYKLADQIAFSDLDKFTYQVDIEHGNTVNNY